MKILIFSDIHGNLPATERMLQEVGAVDQYICLGDIVNYAPWSNECVDLVTSLPNCIILQGNHEEYFLQNTFEEGKSPIAAAFFDFCYPRFDRFTALEQFIPEYKAYGFTFTHTILNKYIYPDTELSLDGNYVIGHSHHQFKTESNGFVLYNAGSVGQNRKYINLINYLVFYPEESRFELGALPYDVESVIDEMRRLDYPEICIDYYNNKARFTE